MAHIICFDPKWPLRVTSRIVETYREFFRALRESILFRENFELWKSQNFYFEFKISTSSKLYRLIFWRNDILCFLFHWKNLLTPWHLNISFWSFQENRRPFWLIFSLKPCKIFSPIFFFFKIKKCHFWTWIWKLSHKFRFLILFPS